MSLKLQLKAGQKIIINGAVLENASSRSMTLFLHNRALILRDTEIITEDAAVTPASRIYYVIQCIYIFPDEESSRLPILNQLMQDYLEAAPSSHDIFERLIGCLEKRDLYQALRAARELINHEGRVLHHGQRSPGDVPGSASGG